MFALYSLYAWCCPLVLVLVGLLLDALEADVIRPNIDSSCWFYGEIQRRRGVEVFKARLRDATTVNPIPMISLFSEFPSFSIRC